MKTPDLQSKPSAFDAMTSRAIIAASSPTTQQAFALLALMTLALSEVAL